MNEVMSRTAQFRGWKHSLPLKEGMGKLSGMLPSPPRPAHQRQSPGCLCLAEVKSPWNLRGMGELQGKKSLGVGEGRMTLSSVLSAMAERQPSSKAPTYYIPG